jgi:hypothetical protein
MNLQDIVAIVNSEKAAALCLSKGGWEGWLQAELWYRCMMAREGVEREKPFPNNQGIRCDLVGTDAGLEVWLELKAFGVFREGDVQRFLDGIGLDVQKLAYKPGGTKGVSIFVVPIAIQDTINRALASRKWQGYACERCNYALIYHMVID